MKHRHDIVLGDSFEDEDGEAFKDQMENHSLGSVDIYLLHEISDLDQEELEKEFNKLVLSIDMYYIITKIRLLDEFHTILTWDRIEDCSNDDLLDPYTCIHPSVMEANEVGDLIQVLLRKWHRLGLVIEAMDVSVEWLSNDLAQHITNLQNLEFECRQEMHRQRYGNTSRLMVQRGTNHPTTTDLIDVWYAETDTERIDREVNEDTETDQAKREQIAYETHLNNEADIRELHEKDIDTNYNSYFENEYCNCDWDLTRDVMVDIVTPFMDVWWQGLADEDVVDERYLELCRSCPDFESHFSKAVLDNYRDQTEDELDTWDMHLLQCDVFDDFTIEDDHDHEDSHDVFYDQYDLFKGR